MGKEESKDVSSTEAVLMGALASGVNIGSSLILFLAQTGLVSVEQQMEEIGLLKPTEEVKKEE